MATKIELSEIRRKASTNYVVVMTAGDGSVTAKFEVLVITHQRGRFGHHTEVEKLEREARERVLDFCKRMTAS